jgi:hypothetical protein
MGRDFSGTRKHKHLSAGDSEKHGHRVRVYIRLELD